MNCLARLLRWLADKCGGETDDDLRARMLGLVRGHHHGAGSRAGIETVIAQAVPPGISLRFEWGQMEGSETLTVRFN